MKFKFWKRYHKIFIVPTRFGVLFFVGVGVMMLIAGTYSNNLVFLHSFFLFSIAVAAMVQTHQNLKGVTSVKIQAAAGPSGDELHMWFELESSKRTRAAALRAEGYFERTGQVHQSPEEVTTQFEFLPGIGSQRRDARVRLTQRGIYHFKYVRVSTMFPLGLFYAWVWLPIESEFFVYPRPSGDPQFPAGTADTDSAEVGQADGGQDFSGHRRFFLGESERHVDWKALARGRPRLVKEFRDGAPEKVVFDFEQTPGTNSEERLSQMALWISEAHRVGVQFGIQINGQTLLPASGIAHFYKCLRSLAEFPTREKSAA